MNTFSLLILVLGLFSLQGEGRQLSGFRQPGLKGRVSLHVQAVPAGNLLRKPQLLRPLVSVQVNLEVSRAVAAARVPMPRGVVAWRRTCTQHACFPPLPDPVPHMNTPTHYCFLS